MDFTDNPNAQGRFGQTSSAEVDRLVELTKPQPDWLVLDVATGKGHTVLELVPLVRQVIASDLNPVQLSAARTFLAGQGAHHVTFTACDAGNLPLTANMFDLVTCRSATRHFRDGFRFTQECVRVLKPGGVLLVEAHLLPDDERAARYLDAFERLRDPSHRRGFAEYEWRGMFLDADLRIEHVEAWLESPVKLLPWADRRRCTPAVIERLQIMLAQAPRAVADWLRPQCAGTPDAAFDRHRLLITGRKPR